MGSTHKAQSLTTMLREACSGYHLPTTPPMILPSIGGRNQIRLKMPLFRPLTQLQLNRYCSVIRHGASTQRSSIIKDERCYIDSVG
ncbi:hypothetical protein GJ496_008587 [Pomphorhynchus laevis]|nr:hypothetical protein GJ496_008587 [Pomphorhynchus laevis]